MEVVEISHEARDVYLIPQNFVDTGTILGGTVKLRNAVEAAVLAVGSAVPLFYLPLAFNIRLMIVIAVSVPLGAYTAGQSRSQPTSASAVHQQAVPCCLL